MKDQLLGDTDGTRETFKYLGKKSNSKQTADLAILYPKKNGNNTYNNRLGLSTRVRKFRARSTPICKRESSRSYFILICTWAASKLMAAISEVNFSASPPCLLGDVLASNTPIKLNL